MARPFSPIPITQFQSSMGPTPWDMPGCYPVTTNPASEPILLILCYKKKPTYALAESMKSYEVSLRWTAPNGSYRFYDKQSQGAISNVRMHFPNLNGVDADKISFYVFTDNELVRIPAVVWAVAFHALGESRFICIEVDGESSSLPAFPFRFSISQWFVPPMEFPPLPPASWNPYPLPSWSSVESPYPPPPFTTIPEKAPQTALEKSPKEKTKRIFLLRWMKTLLRGSD
ncbi:hypothetical protein OF83DRAFT_592041 [Amylostereum chailletii]|nr:hypothetical protein OF83DRAFT_592041 [Amylostereum chailletii]